MNENSIPLDAELNEASSLPQLAEILLKVANNFAKGAISLETALYFESSIASKASVYMTGKHPGGYTMTPESVALAQTLFSSVVGFMHNAGLARQDSTFPSSPDSNATSE